MPSYGFSADRSKIQKLRDEGKWISARAGRAGSGRGFYVNPSNKRPPSDRRPESPNNENRRADDIAALSYFQFDSLDRSQTYANAGETVPIVFCSRQDDKGGIWVSLPLIDQVCDENFNHEFSYLLTQGQTRGGNPALNTVFVGKRGIAELTDFGVTFSLVYSSSPTVCPYDSVTGTKLSCNHKIFKSAIDSLAATVGSNLTHRPVSKYAMTMTFRFKPVPEEQKGAYVFKEYEIVVSRLTAAGLAGPIVIVDDVITTQSGLPVEIVDNSPTPGSIYLIEVNKEIVGGVDEVKNIAIQVEQDNAFPKPMDRTASYVDTTFLVAKGNLFDPGKEVSNPNNLKQIHYFCSDGMLVDRYRFGGGGIVKDNNSSNEFADLLNFFITGSGNFGSLNRLLPEDIATAAAFHSRYEMFFNGVVASTTNFLSWAQSLAPYFLNAFYVWQGAYQLVPLVPLDGTQKIDTGALPIKEKFDDQEDGIDKISNAIIAESYQKTYIANQDRAPFKVIVSWRGQDEYGLESMQTTSVRYGDYEENVPEEAYDFSTFASNTKHAETYAKYLLATRRHSTHVVSFSTPRNTTTPSNLRPYDLIELSLKRVNSKGDSRVETNHYLVRSLTFNQDGILEVVAEHFPLTAGGAGVISTSIESGNFIIDS